MKLIDKKIVEAIKSGDEKKLQKYSSKKHIDTACITECLEKYEEFELAEKFNLLEQKINTKSHLDYRFRKAYERNDIERLKSITEKRYLSGDFKLNEESASFVFADAIKKKNVEVIKILADVAVNKMKKKLLEAMSKRDDELKNLLLDAGVNKFFDNLDVAYNVDCFVNSIKRDPRVIQTLENSGREVVLYWALKFADNQLKDLLLQEKIELSLSTYAYCNQVYRADESDYQMLAEAIKADDRLIKVLHLNLKEIMLKKMIREGNIEMQNKLVESGCFVGNIPSFDFCVDAIRKNNALSKVFACEKMLNEAIKNNVSDIGGLLLEARADRYNERDYLKDVCRIENLEMTLAYMKRQVSVEEFKENSYGPRSPKYKKFIEIYDKPENFLKLNLVLTDDEVIQFKKAAMYGLMKRYKDMPENEKTAEFEKKNAAIVRKIKEKADQIERPNKEVEEKEMQA